MMELTGYVILLVQTIDDEMKLYGEFIKRRTPSIIDDVKNIAKEMKWLKGIIFNNS